MTTNNIIEWDKIKETPLLDREKNPEDIEGTFSDESWQRMGLKRSRAPYDEYYITNMGGTYRIDKNPERTKKQKDGISKEDAVKYLNQELSTYWVELFTK